MGMICTTTDKISIPVGEMYFHAKMFCTLTHTSSILMDAINFYMQERFQHSPIRLVFTCKNAMYLPARMFCTLVFMSSNPMDAINFYMRERFLHSLIQLLYPCLWCIYLQECSVHSPLCLLFPWGQCRAWNLFWASVAKLVLWQLIILLPCTLTHTSSILMGAINFYMQEHFLHSLLTRSRQFLPIAPILTMLTKVWPRANWAMVTNNLTVLTKVSANQNHANREFPVNP